MTTVLIVCGPDDVMGDVCWSCGGSIPHIRKALGLATAALTDSRGHGRYCLEDCVADADEDFARQRENRRCTVCGQAKGHCTTDHPEDPHEYEAFEDWKASGQPW